MALYQLFSPQPDIQIGIWRMEEDETHLMAALPEQIAGQVKRFTAPHRRIEWLSVRVLLQHLLSGQSPDIQYAPSGAPILADGSFAVSISHTKGYACVMLAPACLRIGIDIEQWGERVRKVASRFMRDDELASPYQESSIASLLLHWSAKEAIYKCMEIQEEVDFKEHLRIFPFEVKEEGTFQAQEYRSPRQHPYTVSYRLHPDFVLTWTLHS